MIPFLTWCGFALTVSLVLLPSDTAAAFQLVARIALGSVAGFAAFRFATDGYLNDLGDFWKGLLFAVPAAAVFLFFDLYWELVQAGVAAAVGIGAVWITREWLDEWEYSAGTELAARLVPVFMFLAWVGFVAGVVYALFSGELQSISVAAGLVLLGSGAICFAALTLVATTEGSQFTVEGHWGGLGGGLGGWRLSRTVVFLLLTIVFAGATAAMVANTDLRSAASGSVESEQVPGGSTTEEHARDSEEQATEPPADDSDSGEEAVDESIADESEEPPDEDPDVTGEDNNGHAE